MNVGITSMITGCSECQQYVDEQDAVDAGNTSMDNRMLWMPAIRR